jgi:hypothetical protein
MTGFGSSHEFAVEAMSGRWVRVAGEIDHLARGVD